MNTYYSILGLPAFATREQVKRAFKQLAFRYHPDKNPNNKLAEEQFKLINEAYHYLNDPLRKQQYDQLLRSGSSRRAATDPSRAQSPPRDPRYRRPVYVRKTYRPEKHHDPSIPNNTQSSFLAIGVVIYMFVLVNSAFDFIARYNYYCGHKAWERQERKEAINYLANSVVYDRSYYKSYLLLSAIYADQNQHYDAAENMTLAIENAKGFYPEFYLRRAIALLYSRIKEEAEIDIELARKHGLLNPEIKLQIGRLYLSNLYDYPKAQQYFNETLQDAGASAELYYLLSITAQKLRNYPQEIYWLSESIQYFGGSANTYYQRAWAYINNQETETGCADWKLARQLDPSLKDQMLGFYCLPFDYTEN